MPGPSEIRLIHVPPIQLVPTGNMHIQPSTKPGNPLSLEEAFDLLTSTLNHPTESRVCARRLHVAVERVQDEWLPMSTAKAVRFAKSRPQFLRASIRLLTRKRTPAQFSHLVSHLLLCSCDFSEPGMFTLHMPTPEWHIPDGTVYPSDLSALNQTLCLGMGFIRATVSGMTTNKFRNSTLVPVADSQPWPLNADDLLPFGIQDSIDALRMWTAPGIGGYEVWSLASGLAKFYEPFAIAVAKPPNYDFAFYRPLHELNTVLNLYENRRDLYQAYAGTVEYAVGDTFDFFLALKLSAASGVGTGLRRVSLVLNPILDRVSRLLPSMSFAPPRRRQMEIAVESLRAVANGLEVVPRLDGNLIAPAFAEILDTGRGGCGCVTCPSTNNTSSASRCGGCGLSRYCSKACQKAAWKSPNLPHKQLCPLIKELQAHLGARAWAKLWTPGFHASQVESLLKAKKVDPMKFIYIGGLLDMTRQHKIAYRESKEIADIDGGGEVGIRW